MKELELFVDGQEITQWVSENQKTRSAFFIIQDGEKGMMKIGCQGLHINILKNLFTAMKENSHIKKLLNDAVEIEKDPGKSLAFLLLSLTSEIETEDEKSDKENDAEGNESFYDKIIKTFFKKQ